MSDLENLDISLVNFSEDVYAKENESEVAETT